MGEDGTHHRSKQQPMPVRPMAGPGNRPAPADTSRV